jgi:hypothetical protein
MILRGYLMKISELLKGKSKTGPLMGVEYEVEGLYLPHNVAGFAVHNEGSLRNVDGHPAREYVTNAPSNLDNTIKQLDTLNATFNSNVGCSPLFSNRTSVHVHLNVSDLTVEEWFTLLFIWTVYEDSFIKYCGDERKGNLFCLSSSDAEAMLFYLEDFAIDQEINLFGDNVRYAACNLAATPKYGSLEFRCMRGTTDPNVLIPWFSTINSLYHLAKHYGTPNAFIERFIDEPEAATIEMFGDKHFIFNDIRWKEDAMEKARRLSLTLVLCNWDNFNFYDEPFNDI